MTSCVEDADEFDDLFKETTVVKCILKGGNIWSPTQEAEVYYSRSLLKDEERTNIEDAIVKIRLDGNESTWTWDDSNIEYKSDPSFAIEPGNACVLDINKASGENFTASCTVPSLNEITIDNTEYEFNENSTGIKVDWKSNHELGYVRVELLVDVQYQFFTAGEIAIDRRTLIYEVIGSDYPVFSSSKTFSYLDSITDEDISTSLRTVRDTYVGADSTIMHILGTHINVQTFDTHLAHRNKTVFLQLKNAQDPFAEPVIIYSNLSDGVGVFGAVWGNSGDKVENDLSTRIR